MKINIPEYLIKLREMLVDAGMTSWQDRMMMRAWALTYRYPFTYRLSQWLAKWDMRRRANWIGTLPKEGKDDFSDRGWIQKLPGPAKGWTDQRDMPTPPSQSFRDWWAKREKNGGGH